MRDNAPMYCLPMLLFAGGVGCGSPEVATEVPNGGSALTSGPLGPVGSSTCGGCHPEEQAAWTESHHARAETREDVTAGPGPSVVALDAGAGQRDWPITGWIGVSPLRQPLVALGEGRLQVSQRAWDVTRDEWFDVFADERQPGDRGHWTGPSMTWNSQCAPCHNTALEVGYDAAAHRYRTTQLEHGVGCEACHGDGQAHVSSEGRAPVPHPSLGMEGCAACHARRADLAPSLDPAPVFLDRFAPQLVDAGDDFWPDGRVRTENFEYVAFLGSRMFQEGVVCIDCHDPHRGTLLQPGDALCLRCHATQPTFEPHDLHEGRVACVDCHMPRTTYMQRDPRRDHGFHLPDPELAQELGLPDVCTTACHTDRSPTWAATALSSRGVDLSARPHRERARAVATARRGDPAAVPALREIATRDPHPTWRAVAVGLLGDFGSRPGVSEVLARAATDPEPLVRFTGVGALPSGHPGLVGALDDELLAVRVQAARGLVTERAPTDPRMAPLRTWLEASLDQPDPATEWGVWLDGHGDAEGLAVLARTVARWPGEPTPALALAIAHARRGDPARSVEVLRTALRHRPEVGALHDALGRALASTGDLDGAAAALERAVERLEAPGRSWYNLGLVRDQAGNSAGALEALRQAEAASPDDPDPPWAQGTVLLRLERYAEARAAVQRALALQPHHPGARALLVQIPSE